MSRCFPKGKGKRRNSTKLLCSFFFFFTIAILTTFYILNNLWSIFSMLWAPSKLDNKLDLTKKKNLQSWNKFSNSTRQGHEDHLLFIYLPSCPLHTMCAALCVCFTLHDDRRWCRFPSLSLYKMQNTALLGPLPISHYCIYVIIATAAAAYISSYSLLHYNVFVQSAIAFRSDFACFGNKY